MFTRATNRVIQAAQDALAVRDFLNREESDMKVVDIFGPPDCDTSSDGSHPDYIFVKFRAKPDVLTDGYMPRPKARPRPR
jgi:hypothetical protein